MVELLTFQDALDITAENTNRHLLLGNGFSIACKPKIFTYGSLFDNADFSANPKLPSVFDALDTTDFEVAINSLEASARLTPIYAEAGKLASQAMKKDAEALKEILISTVTANHPNGPFDISEEEFFACRQFLANFIAPSLRGHIYTFNYDLLLYWTAMHSEFSDGSSVELNTIDGFGDDDPNNKMDYVVWQGEGSRLRSSIYYLHGALHLFDAGNELQKFTWIRKDERLKDQAWEAMQSGRLPLFVAEGTSAQKASKIQHNAYLFQCLKSFRACVDAPKTSLFIHGHSLAENDEHILREIARGKCKRVLVSLHGDPQSASNREIISRARRVQSLRETLKTGRYDFELFFYDAESAAVWGS